MLLNVYSIYDTKAKAYINPFLLPNDSMALRTFTDCVNDINHQFSKNPDDYILYKLSEFDNTSGSFLSEKMEQICKGSDVANEKKYSLAFEKRLKDIEEELAKVIVSLDDSMKN